MEKELSTSGPRCFFSPPPLFFCIPHLLYQSLGFFPLLVLFLVLILVFLRVLLLLRKCACHDLLLLLGASDYLNDVYDGALWREWKAPFFDAGYDEAKESGRLNLAVELNLDWYQPFEHVQYSVGVLFLAILNLPPDKRLKKENVILFCTLPGPK